MNQTDTKKTEAKKQTRQSIRILRSAVLAVLLVVLGATLGFCGEPKSGERSDAAATTLKSAIAQSKVTGQPIMLVFTGSDWCVWCQRLESDVLNKSEFSAWSSKVIPVEVDFPQSKSLSEIVIKRNDALLELYQDEIRTYPTVLFVNAKGTVLAKTGYIDSDVNNWINNADQILPVKSAESMVHSQMADN